MADEYIRRAEALKITTRTCGDYAAAFAEIRKLPAADVAPVVHGKWGDNGISGSMLVKCSVCGFDCGASSFSYCPNCGARMRRAKREAEKLIRENRERLVTPSREGERGMESE